MNTVSINVKDIGKRVKGRPARVELPTRWDRMEVILKIAEVCNIDCTYCYFFNAGDDSYTSHPAYISQSTVEGVADFLATTASESGLTTLQIDFHGGEPTMLKKYRFDEMCMTFRDRLGFIPNLELAMQTNAMLIDDEWIALIAKHDIKVGVSLDGPKEMNDRYRVDHRGRGTYDGTVAGMHRLMEARKDGRLSHGFGLICVADHEHDARTVMMHFVKDLGLKDLHFTFPLMTHDGNGPEKMAPYAKYMCDIFDTWVELNDPRIRIRFIDKLMGLLLGGSQRLASYQETLAMNTAFTIASSGEVVAADDDRVATYAFGNGVIASGGFSVSDFFGIDPMRRYFDAIAVRSETCKACCWGNVCDGGEALGGNTQRFSSKNGFDNPSIYCGGLSALLVKMTDYLIAHGVAFSKIAEVLVDEEAEAAA